MNFILSKIISRPKSVVLSADDGHHQQQNQQKMDNNGSKIQKELSASPLSSFSSSKSPEISSQSSSSSTSSPQSALLISNVVDNSANYSDQKINNELQPSNSKLVAKNNNNHNKSLSTDNNSTISEVTTTTIKTESIISDAILRGEEEINEILKGGGKDGEENLKKELTTTITANNIENENNQEILLLKDRINKNISSFDDKEFVKPTNVLPDIINVQPIKDSDNSNDSLISSLTNNLSGLNLNSKADINNLNVPISSNYDGGISSDDEFYAECQTFQETIQNSTNDITNLNPISTNTNENIQQIDTNNLVLCSSEKYISNNCTAHTDNEFISASNSIVNVIEGSIDEGIVHDLKKENSQIDDGLNNENLEKNLDNCPLNNTLCTKSIENSENNIHQENNCTSEKLNEKPLNITFDPNHVYDNDEIIDDDSITCSDIYIPSVLLRQTEKQEDKCVIKEEIPSPSISSSNKSNDDKNIMIESNSSVSSALLNHEESLNIKTEISSVSDNNENLSRNDEISVNNHKENIEDVPLEMKLSIDSLEELNHQVNTALVSEKIKLNVSNEEPSQFKSLDVTSTPKPPINEEINISDNSDNSTTHSDKLEKMDTVSNSKVLNRTFDDYTNDANEKNQKSLIKIEATSNMTFAASSEAINSTLNLSVNHGNNIYLNGSYDDATGTSFNNNETLPIDDLKEAKINNDETASNEVQEISIKDNLKIGDTNESLNNTLNQITKDLDDTSHPSSLTTNSSKETFNSSVEPMDIDVTPQKQQINAEETSPQTASSEAVNIKKEIEDYEEITSNQDNINFLNENINEKLHENGTESEMNFEFKSPLLPPPFGMLKSSNKNSLGFATSTTTTDDDDFENQPGLILSSTDFDFLLSKGNNNISIQRDSLLLRFDPLLGHAVPVNQQQQQQELKFIRNSKISLSPHREDTIIKDRLSPTTEEKEEDTLAADPVEISLNNLSNQQQQQQQQQQQHQLSQNDEYKNYNLNSINNCTITTNQNNNSSVIINSHKEDTTSSLIRPDNNKILNISQDNKSDDKMSVDVIQDINDVNNKSINNLSTQSEEEKKDYKMEDLEKKIKNEVLKTEDIEKKLKDAEQREEALLKRITEKDKTIAKMSGVIEAYEKAVAELIAEKEQIKQNYERQITELKADRDSNYQHLLSLESTFSDLHVKYERSKQTTEKLRKSEEDLLSEKRQTTENLRLQEQRYEKMKNHALQQLEIANNKLETLSKNHAAEVTKLKALLKKEEIARLSIGEQLQQKARENEELMKICDELINGQGS